jgi:hypothetical protein
MAAESLSPFRVVRGPGCSRVPNSHRAFPPHWTDSVGAAPLSRTSRSLGRPRCRSRRTWLSVTEATMCGCTPSSTVTSLPPPPDHWTHPRRFPTGVAPTRLCCRGENHVVGRLGGGDAAEGNPTRPRSSWLAAGRATLAAGERWSTGEPSLTAVPFSASCATWRRSGSGRHQQWLQRDWQRTAGRLSNT